VNPQEVDDESCKRSEFDRRGSGGRGLGSGLMSGIPNASVGRHRRGGGGGCHAFCFPLTLELNSTSGILPTGSVLLTTS
jgi:hypothetical protein